MAAASVLAGPALAQSSRGVIIDNSGTTWSLQPECKLSDAVCAPTTLSFFIDVGKGLTNQIYIYDNGLITVGAPIVLPTDPITGDPIPFIGNLSQLPPQDYFTPAFTGLTQPASHVAHNFPILDVVFGVTTFQGLPTYDEFQLQPLVGGGPGGFTLDFRYGDSQVTTVPFVAGPGIYQFGALHGLTSSNDAHYVFNLNPVPEPATWTTMILGFGAVGTLLRRRRRPTPALA